MGCLQKKANYEAWHPEALSVKANQPLGFTYRCVVVSLKLIALLRDKQLVYGPVSLGQPAHKRRPLGAI